MRFVRRLGILTIFFLIFSYPSHAAEIDIPGSLSNDISKKVYIYASEYSSLAAAIDSVGTAEKTIVVSDAQQITANKVVPQNIVLKIVKGGKLVIPSGITLKVKGPFEAGLYQVKAGEGLLVFLPGAVREYYAAWWGTKGDGTADDFTAIQAAIDAANISGGGTVFLSKGIYNYGSTIKLYSNVTLAGAGMIESSTVLGRGTVLQYTGSGTGITLENTRAAAIRELSFYTETGSVGIYMPNTALALMERVSVFRFRTGIQLGDTGGFPKYLAYYNKFLFCLVTGWKKDGEAGKWDTNIGIHLVQEANDNLFLDCTVTQTNAQGIYIQSGVNNRILYGDFTNTATGVEIAAGRDNSVIQPRIEWMSKRSSETAIKLGEKAENTFIAYPHIINYANSVIDDSISTTNAYIGDTSDAKLRSFALKGGGNTLYNVPTSHDVCRTLVNPSKSEALFFTINGKGSVWDVKEIRAIALGAANENLEFTLEECSPDGDTCVAIMDRLTVPTGKTSTAKIKDSSVADNAVINLRIGNAGAITQLMVCMKVQ